jgi:hypothetical protein
MAIRVETSKRTGIDNEQGTEISWGHMQYLKSLATDRPYVKMRAEPSPVFNCHGLTFASRRTKITDSNAIKTILKDDNWVEISDQEVLPGDIIIYFDQEGDVNHSGIVVRVGDQLHVPWICSKWGVGAEYLHKVGDIPTDLYGPLHKFYRCSL